MNKRAKNCVYFVSKDTKKISQILKDVFRLEFDQQELLFQLGAIYLNKKRVFSDELVNSASPLQIYLNPKRYPASEIVWKQVIVAQEENFVVINKPWSIPVHSTEDNFTENVLFQLRKILGRELWVTHRLDSAVGGLMVLAKTEKFQREFNQLVAERRVKKQYRALTEKELAPGWIEHFMAPNEGVPKKLSEEFQPGWLKCVLEVKEVKPWKCDDSKSYWEVVIDLQTGRTHQIRAQLSKLGAPILGDKLYRGRNRIGYTKHKIALCASKLEWKDSEGTHSFDLAPPF